MAQKKGGEIEAFFRRPDMGYAVYLVYGPNAGLAHQRARQLARAAVPDPDDPFQLIRMDGDEIAGDPLRLADEANTMGLFGGKRSIWVRAGSRNLAPCLAPVLSTPAQDAIIVVEAGDLQGRNPVRTAVETARTGLALPCFADEPRDVAGLIENVLRESQLTIAPDAREALTDLLGADRLLTMRELEKLATYAHGARTVTLADIEAVMADEKATAVDTVVDAVFTGQVDALDRSLVRLFGEGDDAGVTIGAALRHAMTLHRSRVALDSGGDYDTVERNARLFYKRKAAFKRQLGRWSASALESAIATLREGQAQARRSGSMSETIASRVFLSIATRVARATG